MWHITFHFTWANLTWLWKYVNRPAIILNLSTHAVWSAPQPRRFPSSRAFQPIYPNPKAQRHPLEKIKQKNVWKVTAGHPAGFPLDSSLLLISGRFLQKRPRCRLGRLPLRAASHVLGNEPFSPIQPPPFLLFSILNWRCLCVRRVPTRRLRRY